MHSLTAEVQVSQSFPVTMSIATAYSTVLPVDRGFTLNARNNCILHAAGPWSRAASGLILVICTFHLPASSFTFPGTSHFSFISAESPYSRQSVQALTHRVQAGRAKSQTRHRSRHSQQWRFRSTDMTEMSNNSTRRFEHWPGVCRIDGLTLGVLAVTIA